MALGWSCQGENSFPGLSTKCCLNTYRIYYERAVSVNIPAGAEQMQLLPGLFPFNAPRGVKGELLLGGG